MDLSKDWMSASNAQKASNNLIIKKSLVRYQNQKGQKNCLNCIEGTYLDIEGGTTCTDCDKGSYTNIKGNTSEIQLLYLAQKNIF